MDNLRNHVELRGNSLSIEIALSPFALEGAEGNQGFANANLQVRLSQSASKAVTVRYTTQDGSATAGQDYEAITDGRLTFLAGTTNLTQTISISILGDTLEEPDESFQLLLSNPANAVIHPPAARIEIADDDEPLSLSENPSPSQSSFPSGRFPWLIFNTSRLRLPAGETAVYQVRGVSARVSDMIVRIRSSHPQLIVEPPTLIFTTTTWQDYQIVTVRARADAADLGGQASLIHSIDASEGFVAEENAGLVSVSLSPAMEAEPNGEDNGELVR